MGWSVGLFSFNWWVKDLFNCQTVDAIRPTHSYPALTAFPFHSEWKSFAAKKLCCITSNEGSMAEQNGPPIPTLQLLHRTIQNIGAWFPWDHRGVTIDREKMLRMSQSNALWNVFILSPSGRKITNNDKWSRAEYQAQLLCQEDNWSIHSFHKVSIYRSSHNINTSIYQIYQTMCWHKRILF